MRAFKAVSRVASQAVLNANLPRNVVKGEWRCMRRRRLYWLFLVEVFELTRALVHLLRAQREYALTQPHLTDDIYGRSHGAALQHAIQKARLHVEHEAGDCVAFLAFLLDACVNGE